MFMCPHATIAVALFVMCPFSVSAIDVSSFTASDETQQDSALNGQIAEILSDGQIGQADFLDTGMDEDDVVSTTEETVDQTLLGVVSQLGDRRQAEQEQTQLLTELVKEMKSAMSMARSLSRREEALEAQLASVEQKQVLMTNQTRTMRAAIQAAEDAQAKRAKDLSEAQSRIKNVSALALDAKLAAAKNFRLAQATQSQIQGMANEVQVSEETTSKVSRVLEQVAQIFVPSESAEERQPSAVWDDRSATMYSDASLAQQRSSMPYDRNSLKLKQPAAQQTYSIKPPELKQLAAQQTSPMAPATAPKRALLRDPPRVGSPLRR